MKKPVVQYNPTGQSGNIFVILSLCKPYYKSQEWTTLMSNIKYKTYDQVLELLSKRVTLKKNNKID